MNQKQKRFVPVAIVSVIILALASIAGFYFWNTYISVKPLASNQIQTEQNRLSNQRSQTGIDIKGLVGQKMTDVQAKEFFGATEIVNNNLPDYIEFWTEAYCPWAGTKYDYDFKNADPFYYSFGSCEQGQTGSHGGCPTCIMSKIKLSKSLYKCESDSREFYNYGGKKLLIDITHSPQAGPDVCVDCKMRIYSKNIPQVLDIKNCSIISFENDFNLDKFNDLLVDGRRIYLFDSVKNNFVYSSGFNSSNLNPYYFSIDKVNKILKNSYRCEGLDCWMNEQYKIEAGGFIKVLSEQSYMLVTIEASGEYKTCYITETEKLVNGVWQKSQEKNCE
jgi:hypothetical protein